MAEMTKLPQELEETEHPGVAKSVKYVVCQFLEETHYRMLHQALSSTWNRSHSLSAAIKLLEQYGVKLSPEQAAMLDGMNEAQQIERLVGMMPQTNNEQFQHFFLQLQLLVSTATRVRQALENGQADQVEEAMDDAERTGIAPYILRMAVVQAGTEVSVLRRQYEEWVRDADAKMAKLIRGQEDALTAQKKLAHAQAQLTMQANTQKDKMKKVLSSMSTANASTQRSSFFFAWQGYTRAVLIENAIRKEYEERIEISQHRLMEFRGTQLKDVRAMMERKAKHYITDLKTEVFCLWRDTAEYDRDMRENQAEVAELEEKLRSMQENQSEKSRKVLSKLNCDNDTTLATLAFQAWVKFRQDYLKDKQMNDAVKGQEQLLNKFMEGKSAETKKLMKSLGAASAAGSTKLAFDGWKELYEAARQEAEMAEILAHQANKMSAFGDRNSKSAMSVMERARQHVDNMLLLKCWNAWRLETKMERTLRLYHGKIDAKRQQLIGVQQMFRNFANQLESGLKEGADTARELKDGPPPGRPKRMQKSDGTISLPDINQRGTPTKLTPIARARTPTNLSSRDVGNTPSSRGETASGGARSGDTDGGPPVPPRNAWN
eukprot:TRINITY_DN3992_c0_g1_i1.p1 TRINITY_DN3992_c0_g1~~TRINITY_DN3992_c0_g1_i1.p1  ORF type:complete len:604 (-),score=123.33 TRINITY_DN3992_c0_g1_i1:499-2310(-)